jgi:hypothetical protein
METMIEEGKPVAMMENAMFENGVDPDLLLPAVVAEWDHVRAATVAQDQDPHPTDDVLEVHLHGEVEADEEADPGAAHPIELGDQVKEALIAAIAMTFVIGVRRRGILKEEEGEVVHSRVARQEEAIHPVVETEEVEDVAEGKGFLESPFWCEMLGHTSLPKISKWLLDVSVMFAMYTSHETIIRSSQRDLPLSNMQILKWQGKLAMRWIGFASRAVNWRLCLLKNVARPQMKWEVEVQILATRMVAVVAGMVVVDSNDHRRLSGTSSDDERTRDVVTETVPILREAATEKIMATSQDEQKPTVLIMIEKSILKAISTKFSHHVVSSPFSAKALRNYYCCSCWNALDLDHGAFIL